MKIKGYLLSFVLGVIMTIGCIFVYSNVINNDIQVVKNIDISKSITDKLNSIKNKISSLKNTKIGESLEDTDKLEKINNIKNILENNYYDPSMISGTKMWDSAMQAYVAGLGDPFTNYLTSTDNKSLHEELKGSKDFQGIGAVVTKVKEGIMIEEILKDSPAQKSGLKPMDIILQASGTDLADIPLGKGINLIKGPAGTSVELTVKRDGKVFKVKVTRAKLVLKSVKYKTIDYKGTKLGYISISTIGEDTFTQFSEGVSNLLSQKVKGIILDLRGNGGGYLDVGYKIGATWAKQGDIIVQTKYRNNLYNKVFRAKVDGILHNFPTIILADDYTASAGEIITAAIRENNENTSKIVGTQTFGKGTIQTIKEFKDNSSLKYTIGKWFTPKGNNVCKKGVLPGNGIKPDIEIKFDLEKYKKDITDNQLEKAKEVLNKMIK